MAFYLMEGILDTIKAYLDSDMAAKISALNTEYGDSLLDDFYAIEAHQIHPVQGYPILEIIGQNMEIIRQSSTLIDAEYDILFRITALQQNDPEKISQKIMRYARAVVELMEKDTSASQFTSGYSTVKKINFSPVFEYPEHSFVAGGEVEVTVRKQDTK